MKVEAGVLFLEYQGVELEAPIVWDLAPGGPIYAMKDGKIFLSLELEEFKALYVMLRDLELNGKRGRADA